MSDTALLIIGCGDLFQRAVTQWPLAEPARRIHTVTLAVDDIAVLPADALAPHPPERTRIFAAIDSLALNFARFDLYAKLRLMGYQAGSLVHGSAMVDAGVVLGENSYVAEGAIIGPNVRIGRNCYIGPGAQLGLGVEIQASSWIDAGAVCGDGARIGQHTTLGPRTVVAAGVVVGDYCDIEIPGHYIADIAPRTFLHPLFGAAVRIYTA